MGKNLANYVGYTLAIILIVVLSWVIYRQIKEYNSLEHDPMLSVLKDILKPVHPIFNKLKLYKDSKSYTLNKDTTFLCLHDEKGDYYPINMLIYVLLHEVSHSINTKDIGHTEEFHRIFNELLQKATDLGIYNPSIPVVKNYCEHE